MCQCLSVCTNRVTAGDIVIGREVGVQSTQFNGKCVCVCVCACLTVHLSVCFSVCQCLLICTYRVTTGDDVIGREVGMQSRESVC